MYCVERRRWGRALSVLLNFIFTILNAWGMILVYWKGESWEQVCESEVNWAGSGATEKLGGQKTVCLQRREGICTQGFHCLWEDGKTAEGNDCHLLGLPTLLKCHTLQVSQEGNRATYPEVTILSHVSGIIMDVWEGTRRRQWHPTPVLLPGKSHRQRSLVGCSPWGH